MRKIVRREAGLGIGLFIFVFLLSPLVHAQEQITITTYYPSPVGIYTQVIAERVQIGFNTPAPGANELRWGNASSARGTLSPDQGGSIELGSTSNTAVPYIDFSRSTTDYDARVYLVQPERFRIDVRGYVQIRDIDGPDTYADIEVKDIYLCQ